MRERVLIVEDEAIIAMLLEEALEEAKFDIVGPAATVKEALALITDELPHAALLDVTLAGGHSFAVADELIRNGIPFAFSTGHNAASMRGRYPGIPTITKPFNLAEIAVLVRKLLKADQESPTV
jgi:DNA-binding response OmpR family regulator